MNKDNLKIEDNAETLSYEKLKEDYKFFYSPSYRVISDGKDPEESGYMVMSIAVENSVMKAGGCVISVLPIPGAKDREAAEQLFTPGSCVEIYAGYADALEAVFIGAVTSVQFIFAAADAPELRVFCTDFSNMLMRNSINYIWGESGYDSFTKVADEIISKYIDGETLTDSAVEDVPIDEKPPFEQRDQSDYVFIREKADGNHIDFFVSGHNIYYQKRKPSASPITALTWGVNIDSLAFTVKTAAPASDSEVKGWNIKDKEAFSAQAGIDGVKDRVCGDKIYDYAEKAYRGKPKIMAATSAQDEETAKLQAENLLIARNKDILSAAGECAGIPQILAGRVLAIEGVGDLLSGDYFIAATKHTINSNGYKTGFNLVEAHS